MADRETLLSICDPIHMVLTRTDMNGDSSLVSSHFLEWRTVLTAANLWALMNKLNNGFIYIRFYPKIGVIFNLLLGFELNAYICIGTKAKNQSHAWVVTVSVDYEEVIFWESLTGNR
jgi:hypothetical protein